jgi:propionyl-CoA carboxylase alpha chain
VEHPVTEMITGKDLVREQILIAEGNPLSFQQEDLSIRGHAIELRVYAEDPKNNFLPDIGKLQTYIRPQGPGIRVDDGFEPEMDIPIYYDPMIAKLISYDENREFAMDKMIRAIDDYQITGIETTLPFGKFVLQHEAFRSGNFDTKFVERSFSPEMLYNEWTTEELQLMAAFSVELIDKNKNKGKTVEGVNHNRTTSKWKNRLN